LIASDVRLGIATRTLLPALILHVSDLRVGPPPVATHLSCVDRYGSLGRIMTPFAATSRVSDRSRLGFGHASIMPLTPAAVCAVQYGGHAQLRRRRRQ
jgi:hypothetical protein